ncbi:alpha/beta fold hydrolase [Thalassorhabdomicrobium marinisediminis]|uniref:alpha/beta fold hydrolase n=1 Tax=Thalassorhabdomicrobium marinisediminis TaxID=2170577 RepID=UPI00248F95B8|nr:alpha/beta hydrolase [Thalassorhabdomicrobium marinisediminis]
MHKTLKTPQGREIAYHRTEGRGPAVVFLGGFKSDMGGTKAVHLETWAKEAGRAYVRLDYSGHGISSGTFEEGSIGDWVEDSCAVLELIEGPLVLVGSSMGGWIALQIARAQPERIAGLVGIAAAPDFTEDGFWANFPPHMREALEREGKVSLPSDYGEPYVITKRLIEEGRERLVLRTPLSLPFPVRLLQGTEDTSVTTETAVRLLEHAVSPDMRLTLVKGADHSFSSETCLPLIVQAIEEVS